MRVASGPALVLLLMAVSLPAGEIAAGTGSDESRRPVTESRGLEEKLERIEEILLGGRYSEAEQASRNLLEETTEAFGDDSFKAARVMDSLVEVLQYSGHIGSAELRSLAERAVQIKEARLDRNHPEVAVSLTHLALILREQGHDHEALPISERAVRLLEGNPVFSKERTARALREHATLLLYMGQADQAEPFARRALDVVDGNARAPIDQAKGLALMATVHQASTAYEEAERLYEESLALLEEHLGEDHFEVSVVLTNMASLYWELGRYSDAKPLFERALAVRRATLGEDHALVATSMNNLGLLLAELDDFHGAESLYRSAIRSYEKHLGPDHVDLASAQNNLAVLFMGAGKLDEARLLMERALRVHEMQLGPDHPLVASDYNNLGALLSRSGLYPEAKRALERSVEVDTKNHGPDHPTVATDLSNLALLMQRIGSYEEALALLDDALAIRVPRLGERHPDVAVTLRVEGLIRLEMGDPEEARRLFQQARDIWEETLGPDHPKVAKVLHSLGDVLTVLEEFDAAEQVYLRAMAIHEGREESNRLSWAATGSHLATLYRQRGRYDEAETLFRRAIDVWESELGGSHPRQIGSLNGLGRLRYDQGNVAEALTLALRAESISRRHVRLTTRYLAESRALKYAAVRESGLDLVLSSVVGRDDMSARRKAWDALARSRAMVFDELASRHRRRQTTPEVARLAAAVADAGTQVANLVFAPERAVSRASYRLVLQEARRGHEQAEEALAALSEDFRQREQQAAAGFEEVAAALPERTALISYVLYEHFRPRSGHEEDDGAKNGQRNESPAPDGTPAYAVFVLLERMGDPLLIPLGPAEQIDSLVREWRQEIDKSASSLPMAARRAEARYRAVAEKLREVVWDPWSSLLTQQEQVIIVPDGILNTLSFASLPASDGTYLVEEHLLVHYLSAERDLIRHGANKQRPASLLAMGGVDYDRSAHRPPDPANAHDHPATASIAISGPAAALRGAAECVDLQAMRFGPLPESARELAELRALLEKEHGANVRFTGLDRSRASESAFKKMASQFQILHLATHAFVFSGRCVSALEKRAVDPFDREPGPVTGDNPLLLTGLALAGANQRDDAKASPGDPVREDGLLTAQEISDLDLSGVNLAVLSACETGSGRLLHGEGVLGLRRAFQMAGADSLVMSLWRVADQETRRWMVHFYRNYLTRGTISGAARDASRTVLEARRQAGQSTHPFYWAAFVSTGDWQ